MSVDDSAIIDRALFEAALDPQRGDDEVIEVSPAITPHAIGEEPITLMHHPRYRIGDIRRVLWATIQGPQIPIAVRREQQQGITAERLRDALHMPRTGPLPPVLVEHLTPNQWVQEMPEIDQAIIDAVQNPQEVRAVSCPNPQCDTNTGIVPARVCRQCPEYGRRSGVRFAQDETQRQEVGGQTDYTDMDGMTLDDAFVALRELGKQYQ